MSVVEKLITDEAGVISLYYGEDTAKEDAEKLSAQLAGQYSDLDVSLYYGGQPVYYYIISVE